MLESEVILDIDNELMEGGKLRTFSYCPASHKTYLPTPSTSLASSPLTNKSIARTKYRRIGIFERVGPAECMAFREDREDHLNKDISVNLTRG